MKSVRIVQARNDQHLQPKWSAENVYQIRHECFEDQTPTDPRKLPQYREYVEKQYDSIWQMI